MVMATFLLHPRALAVAAAGAKSGCDCWRFGRAAVCSARGFRGAGTAHLVYADSSRARALVWTYHQRVTCAVRGVGRGGCAGPMGGALAGLLVVVRCGGDDTLCIGRAR